MTFPLGSLRAEGGAASSTYTRGKHAAQATSAATTHDLPTPRWRHQAVLVAGAVLWLLLLLALATHHLDDPGFSTSGDGAPLRNKAGVIGAWLSDLGLFLFGYSVWWLVPVGARAWLSRLARAVRSDEVPAAAAQAVPRAAFWVGLVLLMAASASLEWTRLYQWEPRLPGHAGGVLGFTLGPLSTHWLGFAGSGVLWIAALVAGMSLALGFSWLALADRIGTALDGLRERRQQQKAQAEDRRIGERSLVEREQEVEVERQEVVDHVPLVIEPTLLEVPKSERVAKERQKPLFVELADTKLPQVDLLDAAPPRVESVTPELAGDDLAADREEAQGLRCRGARGRGLARPGDHALRDRAGHRREGRAGGQPGQGPGALAVAGEHPRGRDHSRQELHGAGTAQRAAPDHPPGRDPGLAGLQRRGLAADHRAGQGHRRQPGGGRPGARCRTAWWPAPPARASRWASTR